MNKLLTYLFLFFSVTSHAQQTWHGKERTIHYTPDGKDFVTTNGTHRFNRALYGSNTGFRSEAGDLPEFALYLPGMGGNLKFGLIADNKSKWLIHADKTEARYRPGSMLYSIEDNLIGKGKLHITAIGLYEREGLIVKIEAKNITDSIQLIAAFGGATGTRFSREGDIGADPESSFYLKPEYCRDNIYRIEKNTFTLFFGSRRPLTEEQRYEIQHSPVQTTDTSSVPLKNLTGVFPAGSILKLADAAAQQDPLQFFSSTGPTTPAIITSIPVLNNSVYYFLILNGKIEKTISEQDLPLLFNNAELSRTEIASRVVVNTPDPYINTLGGALSVASDAIWEHPSYMHGAVAWRMRLNGWRGAYAADVLGWHDRARAHFDSYALSQLTSPLSAPVIMDTALNLARAQEKLGTSLFSSGYICRNPNGDFRAHHYDMNLVFIDQLLNHFLWTGDTAYVKKMWPLLTRHLDWEKRNFDADGDGLYDAYAAIWASDALQYSGGGVTHSSAYNYRSNRMAADLAKMIGENPAPYQKEADKIIKAINSQLWIGSKGWYAEYKDLLGKKLLHPSAGLWTVYHAIDSKVPDPFQSYQLLKYVDAEIPRIPILAKGLADTTLYTISTTNWQPYTWSLNNVVLAEVLHTALAYWQGGRNEEAYKLWKSALIESMYLGASPGNIQQLSFYDAIRGELYRDFADDIGMAARSLVEGLFGIMPDALRDTLYINPGFPADWQHASIKTPDIDFSFFRKDKEDNYHLSHSIPGRINVLLRVKAKWDDIESITVNGKPGKWVFDDNAIGAPVISIFIPSADEYQVIIKWKGGEIESEKAWEFYFKGEQVKIDAKSSIFSEIYDPQRTLSNATIKDGQFTAINKTNNGYKTFFIKTKQGKARYWMPVSFNAEDFFTVMSFDDPEVIGSLHITRGSYKLSLNYRSYQLVNVPYNRLINIINVKSAFVAGTNSIRYQSANRKSEQFYTEWDINNNPDLKYEKIDLTGYFNDEVNNIFKNKYLSPRPKVSTLQLPTQGIGNWAYALVNPVINDSGLRKRAMGKNEIVIKQGAPFRIDPTKKNIVFTSQWDNFPDSVIIPLKGRSSHAYMLMAGSTNPMQSRLINGEVVINYRDGSSARLELRNPENWWPIEQDYYEDGFAFTTSAPKPVRVYLKTGEDTREFKDFVTIRGFSNKGVDGGAATVLDLPLNPSKELKSITIKAVANDVIIGLMSLTLVRP